MDKENNNDYLKSHIENFWSENNKREFIWKSGPIPNVYKNFSVFQIEPQKTQDEWVYITSGASEVHSPNHENLEFFILSPKQDLIHVDTLAMVANFHADSRYGGIHLGRVIEIGRPWIDKSSCEYLLVSLPYANGKEFEYIYTKKIKIRLLWLLPITKNEANYIYKYGQEKMEEIFEEKEIDYLNPNRQSVV